MDWRRAGTSRKGGELLKANDWARQQTRIVENGCIKIEMHEAPVEKSLATDGEGHRLF